MCRMYGLVAGKNGFIMKIMFGLQVTSGVLSTTAYYYTLVSLARKELDRVWLARLASMNKIIGRV